jgi:hypothetical protein
MRKLLLAGLAGLTVAFIGASLLAQANQQGPTLMTETAEVQSIEYLRRLYGKATDLIGQNTPDSIAAGKAIYRQIFTPDAKIRTANTGADPLTAEGPDEWADVVLDALKDYKATQHLIGTQVVELNGDSAQMESYLDAWHQNADNSVWIFRGTYTDHVRKSPAGWQIYDMTLRMTIGYNLPAQE